MKMIDAVLAAFRPKKTPRQARYTFNPSLPESSQQSLPFPQITPEQAALRVTEAFPVTIVARQYNQLPESLKVYFRRGVK